MSQTAFLSWSTFSGFGRTFGRSASLALQSFVNVCRKGPVEWDLANTVHTPSKDVINLRLALEHGPWSVAAFGDNVTDERYPTLALIDAFGPGVSYRSPNNRRQYGAEVAYRF